MENFCTADQNAFHNHVMSLSDEAFLIIVLMNYSARWYAELTVETKKVSARVAKQNWD